ncbi:hypothetical protein U1Q18_007482, partial [Sarracenia purpurea var. burkii]
RMWPKMMHRKILMSAWRKEECEDVVTEGATGVGDENDEEGDSEDVHDSEEKNDPEITEGTDVPASTPTSHKVSGPVSVFCEPVSSSVVHGLNGDFDSAHIDTQMVHAEGNSCLVHLMLDEMPHPVLVNKIEEVRDSDESEVEEDIAEEDCMSCSDDVALPVGDKMNQVHEFEHPTVQLALVKLLCHELES